MRGRKSIVNPPKPAASVLLSRGLGSREVYAILRARQLRFFGGFTTVEAAELLGVSVATAERYWQFARAWLFDHLSAGSENPPAV